MWYVLKLWASYKREAHTQQVILTSIFRNGSVVLTVSLGGPRSRQDNFLALTLCCVKADEWNLIEAGRDGREGYLRMNGQRANGLSPGPLTTLGRRPASSHFFPCRRNSGTFWILGYLNLIPV